MSTEKKKKIKSTRRDKILELFKENDGVISMMQIHKRLGIKNPSACMAGLRMPERSGGKPLLTTFDDDTKTFTLINSEVKE